MNFRFLKGAHVISLCFDIYGKHVAFCTVSYKAYAVTYFCVAGVFVGMSRSLRKDAHVTALAEDRYGLADSRNVTALAVNGEGAQGLYEPSEDGYFE